MMRACFVVILISLNCFRFDAASDFFQAVGKGNVEDVKGLLHSGLSIASKNEYGETALHVSAISGNLELLQLLLDAGGDPSAVTSGTYPGHKSIVQRSVLMWYLPTCKVEPVQVLLNAGADLAHVNEEGETALDIATKSGERCKEVVDLLRRWTEKIEL